MFARLSGTMRYRGTRIGVVAVLAAAGVTGSLAASQASASSARQPCHPAISVQPFGKTIEPYTGKLTQTYRWLR